MNAANTNANVLFILICSFLLAFISKGERDFDLVLFFSKNFLKIFRNKKSVPPVHRQRGTETEKGFIFFKKF